MKREKSSYAVGLLRRTGGFTLIELMVVVVIIGILAAVALPRFMTQQRKAREGTGWADLDSMTTACEMYYLDTDTYPLPAAINIKETAALAKLITDTVTGWAGPYMKYRKAAANIPTDPWGNTYFYEGDSTTKATNYSVWCKGGYYDSVNYSAKYINPGWFKSP